MMPKFYGSSCDVESLGLNGHIYRILRELRRWVGVPLVVILFLIISYQIFSSWTVILPWVSQMRIGWFFAGIGLTIGSIFMLGWNWVYILDSCEMQVSRTDALALYLLTNLARYIPGGIWHFVGRTASLAKLGHKPGYVITSLILEQMMVLISAGAIGFSLSGLSIHVALAIGISIFMEIALALLAGIATGYITVHTSSTLKSRRVWVWPLLVLGYNLFWVINGFSTICLYAALMRGEKVNSFVYVNLIGQTALSWVAGYIVLFIPGGWGVREAVFIYLLHHNSLEEVAIILPILSRLTQMLAELICLIIISLTWYSRQKHQGM